MHMHRSSPASMTCLSRLLGIASIAGALSVATSTAPAQVVVYETLRPIVPVAPVMAPAYVANYTPAGNYAAVTAYSPPVVATVPSSSVAVTSYYAPAMSTAVPVTSFYAPAMATPVATTAYYAPAATVVASPVTAYYAPAAVAVPLYRRGLFGGYRPVRTAYYYPY